MAEEHPELGLPDVVSQRAAELLTERMGRRVGIASQEVLRRRGHGRVVRLLLTGAAESSVVLKLAGGGRAFDPHDPDPWGPAARLWNEWAGLEFLSELASTRPPVPRFLGGDHELGFLLMEDLGAGPSLADVLLDKSPGRARAALGGYVDALADIHVATFGHADGYQQRRASFGGEQATLSALFDADGKPRLLESVGRLAEGIDALAVVEALSWIDEVVTRPGLWRAFSVSDCCPDNNRVDDDGSVRLFDLEYAKVQHALLDLAYVRTTMPTCWCLRRLQTELSDDLVERYWERLRRVGHAAGREEFDAALNACQAYWAVEVAGWHASGALESGGDERPYLDSLDFHLASRRQMFLQRMDDLADAATRQPELAPLGPGLAKPLEVAARKQWGSVEQLPLYPAFSRSSS